MSDHFGPGDRIAGYRIEWQIGRGGMAVVYLAEQVTLGRDGGPQALGTTADAAGVRAFAMPTVDLEGGLCTMS